jgi:hypothetical protein
MPCVLQEWVCDLTMMQQSVLIAAVRGPDGIRKDHVAKLLLRWMRRCVLYSAMDRRVLMNPYDLGGGSFTGPSIDYRSPDLDRGYWQEAMQNLVNDYLRAVDELPHHFQLHFMHAAEILGYKHPNGEIGEWWDRTYRRIANDAHLEPESEKRMDWRLGDNREQWLAAEEVTAASPTSESVAQPPTL